MKRTIAILVLAALSLCAIPKPAAAAEDHVVLAGGCFWGMQAVFESLRGVRHVVAGFAGGSALTAHYEMVSTGVTGHAESVDITFDPSVISFRQLLDVYFRVAHDPTELNRQGPDEGTQYRSEIFYTSASQRAEAQAMISGLRRLHVFHTPIVTTLAPLNGFFPAEAYHQDYLVHNPQSQYIEYNDIPKLRALKSTYPRLVNARSGPMETLAKVDAQLSRR